LERLVGNQLGDRQDEAADPLNPGGVNHRNNSSTNRARLSSPQISQSCENAVCGLDFRTVHYQDQHQRPGNRQRSGHRKMRA